MLDEDIAALYGVETKNLIKAMKRNLDRFPLDFMFHLTPEEVEILRFQIGTSSWGGRRYPPYAFTEGLPPLLEALRVALAPDGHRGEITANWCGR